MQKSSVSLTNWKYMFSISKDMQFFTIIYSSVYVTLKELQKRCQNVSYYKTGACVGKMCVLLLILTVSESLCWSMQKEKLTKNTKVNSFIGIDPFNEFLILIIPKFQNIHNVTVYGEIVRKIQRL